MRISDWSSDVCSSDLGRLEIDNNIAERAMRCVALGRKNWLFAGSKAGGDRAAAIYSVIESAKLNGLEPRSEEHTSELQSLMRISYAVFCLKKKTRQIGKTRQWNTETQSNLQSTLT